MDVMAQLTQHVNITDCLEAKPTLHLLAKHHTAVTLPSKPLALTTSVSSHTVLKPDMNMSFVPSYCIPHNQRALIQEAVEDLFELSVIWEPFSLWNLSLCSFQKMDGSKHTLQTSKKLKLS